MPGGQAELPDGDGLGGAGGEGSPAAPPAGGRAASASAVDARVLAQRTAGIRARIEAACQRAGRPAQSVRLLPVSKTHPLADVLALAGASGLDEFGENRPQELAAKAAGVPEGLAVRFVLIGHLQTNKAALAAQYAASFQALDSLRLAAALDRRLQALGRPLDVLVEVNTSGEPAKHGLAPSAVPGFAAQLGAFPSLRPRGLMTVAVNDPDPARVAACFDTLVQVQRRLRDDGVGGLSWDELSMGMSGDFELAVEHGATCVRVGTAIFGQRG